MTDTVNKLEKKNLENIINKKRWHRRCPRCDTKIIYTNKDSIRNAIKSSAICRSCSNTRHIGPFIKTCSNCQKDMIYNKFKSYKYSINNDGWCHKCAGEKTIKTRIKRKNLYGNRNQSEDSKRKMSLLHSGVNNPFYGKTHTNESRIKMRLNTINYISKIKGGSMFPLYNKNACKYFEKMELETDWNGYYATKNGEHYIKELGYWVDYYEPNKNIVIEWDEKRHYNIDGTLKQKDIDRMTEIREFLKCKFFRYKESENLLYETI